MINKFLWLEPIWITLLVPSILYRDLFWEPWLLPWLIAVLFLFWPIRLFHQRKFAPTTALNRPIFLLMLWLPVVYLSAYIPERSLEAIGALLLGIAYFFAVLNWPPTQRYPWLLLIAFTLIGLVLAALGPALLINIPNKIFEFSREVKQSKPIDLFGSGETINSNILAGILLLVIPLFAAMALRWDWSKRKWWPGLFALITLFTLATLFLTQSRGSYLAMLVVLMLLVTLRWRWAILLILIPVISVAVSASNEIAYFLETIVNQNAVDSAASRWEIWVQSFTALQHSPWTGIGIGTFDTIMPQLFPKGSTPINFTSIPHAHNLILQVGLDLGVPGLVLYLWIWGAAFRILIQLLYKQYRAQRTNDPAGEPIAESILVTDKPLGRHLRRQIRRQQALEWCLATGLLGSFLALWLHGMVDCATWGSKASFLPWLLLSFATLLPMVKGASQV